MARGVEGVLDRVLPCWFIFGIHPASGAVDLYDGDKDICVRIAPEHAEALINCRQEYFNLVLEIARYSDEARDAVYTALHNLEDNRRTDTDGHSTDDTDTGHSVSLDGSPELPGLEVPKDS